MLTSLSTEITHHDAIQYQILELVVGDPTTHEAEQVEQESRDEFYILVSQVEHLLGRHDIWVSALALQAEKDSLASLTDPSKPLFRTGVQAYGKYLDSLNRQAANLLDDGEVSHLVKSLRDALTTFRLEIEKVIPLASSVSDTGHDHPPSGTPAARASPITVDLPKFSGDPLDWDNFNAMFSAAIRTRAAGFSDLDKRCLLLQSLSSLYAQDTIHSAPRGAKLEDLMIRFGRPQVVVLLLIEKMEKPQTLTSDYEGLSRLLQQVVGGYDAVLPHTKDSLATYLVYRTPMSFSPSRRTGRTT